MVIVFFVDGYSIYCYAQDNYFTTVSLDDGYALLYYMQSVRVKDFYVAPVRGYSTTQHRKTAVTVV